MAVKATAAIRKSKHWLKMYDSGKMTLGK